MRRWNWMVVGLVAMTMMLTMVMMVAVRHSTAQEDDWSAIFYDAKADLWWMRATDGSGSLVSFSIPASSLAVNNTGTQLAYCAMDDSGQAIFHLYDPDQQADVLTSDLGPAVECQIDRNAFSSDGARVWVGLSGDPAADQPAWQLIEVQVSDGTVLHRLDSNSPLASGVELSAKPMMPLVLATDDAEVIFAIIPKDIFGLPDPSAAYRWNGTDELIGLAEWGRAFSDGLMATGEVVRAGVGRGLPSPTPPDVYLPYNVVYYLAAGEGPVTIYQSGDWVIRSVAWVNQGQQVAVGLVSPKDVTPSQVRWVLINRDGSVIEHDPVAATSITMMDSRDGYAVFTATPRDNGKIHAVLMRYIGDDGQIVAAFDEAVAPELRWVTPSTPAPDLLPFVPFGLAQTPEATLTTFPSATPTVSFTNTPTIGSTSQPTSTSTRPAPSATNTREPSTATNTAPAPSATSGIRPPSSRTHTPTVAVTSTRISSPTSRPASATPRPSSTVTPAPTNTRPPANTSAPGVVPTSTPRRGQLASPTPNTGPTTRPASATPRPSSTATPAPSRTPTRTPTRLPSLTFTPTRNVVPSKTPLPTTGGLPSKTPISGPTTTLSYGGGNETRLYITNNAGTDLCEIYFTPNTESTWGENYLEQGEILADDDTLSWVVEPAVYDVKVFDCFSNSLEEFGFDLTAGSVEIQVSSSAIIGVPQ